MSSPADTEPRIVEVWAPSCIECRAMESDLQEVAAEFAGRVRLEKVNAAADLAAAQELRAMATPTLIGFVDGAESFRMVGRRSRAELTAIFASAADGQPARGVGSQDRILRIAAGAAVATVGAFAGPAWPLLAVGLGIAAWGLASAHETRNA